MNYFYGVFWSDVVTMNYIHCGKTLGVDYFALHR